MKSKTIREVSCLWKKDKKRYVRESTYATYVLILDNYILPAFGQCETLTESDIQDYVIDMLSKGLSRRSIMGILVVLKMVVRYGMQLGCCWSSDWKIRFPTSRQKDEVAVMSVENHKKLMRYVQENPTCRNIGIYICMSCGLRIGEICALMWKDIDWDRGLIKIRRTLERIYVYDGELKYTKLVLGVPKTQNSIREIPLSSEFIKKLTPICKATDTDNFVLSNHLKPIEPRCYRNYFKRVLKDLDIPNIKFHGLRHSFATRCIECNCDYKTVSSLLGHSSITTTLNLYVHPNLEQKKMCIYKVLEKLS